MTKGSRDEVQDKFQEITDLYTAGIPDVTSHFYSAVIGSYATCLMLGQDKAAVLRTLKQMIQSVENVGDSGNVPEV